MACLSDVDLATLHRSRLEERVNYKLSSLSRDLNNSNCRNNNKINRNINHKRQLSSNEQNKLTAINRKNGEDECANLKTNNLNNSNSTAVITQQTNKINLSVNKTNLNSKCDANIAKFKNCDKTNVLEKKLLIDKAKEKYFINALDTLQKTAFDKNFNYNAVNVNKTERLYERVNSNVDQTDCRTEIKTNDIDVDDFPIMRRRRSRTWP